MTSLPNLKWFKKHKKISALIFIVWNIVLIYFGAFINGYSFIKNTNPFTYFLGITLVNIEPTYKNLQNGTQITLEMINNGDKDIQNLYVNYDFCGTGLKTAHLDETYMRTSGTQYFTINNVSLNTSCTPSPIDATFNIAFDSRNQCYANFTSPITQTCGYCPISLQVYGNDKLIYNNTIEYPFSIVNESTAGILYFYDLYYGAKISFTPNQTLYPNDKISDIFNCIDLNSVQNTNGLTFLSPVSFLVLDTETYCLQGKDPQWCALLYTNFQK